MWLITLETPAEIPTHCPACRPDLDPESFVVAFCSEHRPNLAGSGDERARAAIGQHYVAGIGEAGGEGNRAICALIHRGGAAPR